MGEATAAEEHVESLVARPHENWALMGEAIVDEEHVGAFAARPLGASATHPHVACPQSRHNNHGNAVINIEIIVEVAVFFHSSYEESTNNTENCTAYVTSF